MKPIIFYTKVNCLLCEEAWALLELFDKKVEVRDIHDQDAWLMAYQLKIPVIVVNGQELYGDQINLPRLEQLLKDIK